MILVLFDCDGTLVDSQHIIGDAMDRTFRHHGLDAPGVERTRVVVGLSLPIAIADLLGEDDGERSRRMAETYKEQFQGLRRSSKFFEPMFPGCQAAIEKLKMTDDILIGIVTGKSRRGVRAVVDHHGLGGMFQVVRTADDCPSKPHPAMVLEACAETGIEPQRTFVVGDTRFDMEMAIAAGAIPIGVSWGYHACDELTNCGARTVIDSFGELYPLIDAMRDEERGAPVRTDA